MARHNEIGKIGEDIATKYLKDHGMTILEQNYRKKWGEIDIVARGTSGIVHFVEVKSVSYETRGELEWAVTHETHRPEENVHQNKQNRLKRAIQTWILENHYEMEIQVDILVVRVVPSERFGRVMMLENVIFE